MMRRIRQIVTALIIALLCAVAAIVWYVSLFPEHVFQLAARHMYTGGACSVARVTWRQGGVDLHNLHVTARGMTADVALAQVRVPRLSDGRWALSAALETGLVHVTIVTPKAVRPAEPAPATPFQLVVPPLPVTLSASTMTARVHLPYTTNVLTLDLHAHAGCDSAAATQALAGVDVAMRAPAGGSARVTAWLEGATLHAYCEPAVSSVAYVVRYLPVTLPVTVSKGKVFGSLSASAVLGGTTSAVHAASSTLQFSSDRIRAAVNKTSAYNVHMESAVKLSRPLYSTDAPRDVLTYVLARIEGTGAAHVAALAIDAVQISNIAVAAHTLSGRVTVSTASLQAMGGELAAQGDIRRVKVKDKLAWRWLYDVQCSLTNADAAQVCSLMNLTTNRLEGLFSGRVRVAGFGPRVSYFDGELLSGGGGVLFFPDAAMYLLTPQEQPSLQQEAIKTSVDRLRNYEYRNTHLALSYDPETIKTVLRFYFDGQTQGDTVKFELYYDGTWRDAFNVGKLLIQ